MIAEQGDAQEWAGGELRNNMTQAGRGRELRDIDRPDVRAAADSPVRTLTEIASSAVHARTFSIVLEVVMGR